MFIWDASVQRQRVSTITGRIVFAFPPAFVQYIFDQIIETLRFEVSIHWVVNIKVALNVSVTWIVYVFDF